MKDEGGEGKARDGGREEIKERRHRRERRNEKERERESKNLAP